MKKIAGVLSAFMFVLVGCAADTEDPSQSSENELAVQNAGGADGGKCSIVSGSNAGKSGTYSTGDDGVLYCCVGANGTGDCTDCSPHSDGSGSSCKSTMVKPRVPNIPTVSGGTLSRF